VLVRQRQEMLPMRSKESGFRDHERVSPALHHGSESRLEGGGSACLHALELDAQRLRFALDGAGHEGVARPGRIDEDSHPGDRGYRLFEQLQTLSGNLDGREFQPGEVPTGLCQARREPLFH
jgi:hypothetical protein